MPRGKRAHQLDFGIIYLRLARREFRAAAIAAATSRRFPRGISSRAARARARARRPRRSKWTIINEKSRFVPLILYRGIRRCGARTIVAEHGGGFAHRIARGIDSIDCAKRESSRLI